VHARCAADIKARRKVLVIIAEDWFALSHFVPLLSEITVLGGDVVVATRSSGRVREIEALGARVRSLDFSRGSLNVARLLQVRSALARLIEDERPDIVHAIAMQTMVMTSLALGSCQHRPSAVVLHLTGLGYLGQSCAPITYVLRPMARAALRYCMRTQSAWLIAENSDDLSAIAAGGSVPPCRTAIIPGAGVDPALLPHLPPTANETPRAAFIGRMLVSKGVHILVEAHRLLRARGVQVELDLYGDADPGSRHAISAATLSKWNATAGIRWHGRTGDIVGAWATADIAVVPAMGGDGMPRVMLEAAACGRPLVVSDVSGCREFVRHEVEGLVVPPGDPGALAHAVALLANDRELRAKLGAAARRRVMSGYTVEAVRDRYRQLYMDLIMPVSSAAPANYEPAMAHSKASTTRS
jgi:glycosyltransferase involved in cell wall biosynthesis